MLQNSSNNKSNTSPEVVEPREMNLPPLSHPVSRRVLAELYGETPGMLDHQAERYINLSDRFSTAFGSSPSAFFSSPGRTELSGNHTDHNGGKVLTGSLSIDTIAAARRSDEREIRIVSEGYDDPFVVSLDNLRPGMNDSQTELLIKGILSGFLEKGYKIGGFDAAITSDVGAGSGLSSSASFEMLIGLLINDLYNDNQVPMVEVAKIGRYAENQFWKKPSGLLDQLGCGLGGANYIDFRDSANPKIEQVDYDFQQRGYSVLITNTHSSHAHNSSEYGKVPEEMKEVAQALGAATLSEVNEAIFRAAIPRLRTEVGDRAVLRALHFYDENNRVEEQFNALRQDDLRKFLDLVNRSGRSSLELLQNGYDIVDPRAQAVPLALALSSEYLAKLDKPSANRLHGGGFGGMILTILPTEKVAEYTEMMNGIFGEGSVQPLRVRGRGAVNVSALELEG